MKDESLLIEFSENLTFQDCMRRISDNASGFVIVTKKDKSVVGLLTDGDIREKLLSGVALDSKVSPYLNRNFKYATKEIEREEILKIFDHQIKFIPVLEDGKLVNVITQTDIEYKERESLVVKSKAPARISFGGGGTDLTAFFMERGGAVLNSTINLYGHASLRIREDRKIKITSYDFDSVVEADGWEKLLYDGKLDLIKAAIKLIKPPYGFDLEVYADFPPASGLGGSSVVLTAVIGCFNELRRHRLTPYDVAELAFQAERIELGMAGGWQDQYAAVFGGFNFMEFRHNRNEINTLRIAPNIKAELEERMVLCSTGKPHPHTTIHEDQKDKMVNDDKIQKMADRVREVAYEMKSCLVRGHLDILGDLLHEAWVMKKNLAGGISNSHLDEIYDFARTNGAVGGKILGAGGGGYFLFQSSIDGLPHLIQALNKKGLETRRFTFEDQGIRSWTMYDERASIA